RTSAQTTNIRWPITHAVDEKSPASTRRNVHPFARPEFDQGPVADVQLLRRMLLLLKRSPEQEIALRNLLDEQQDQSSQSYHAWLTSEQFGKEFGPADADIHRVTNW